MKKLLCAVLLAVFVLSLVAVALVTPVQAKSEDGCEWICRQTYYWRCCGDKGTSDPGCTIVGRCE